MIKDEDIACGGKVMIGTILNVLEYHPKVKVDFECVVLLINLLNVFQNSVCSDVNDDEKVESRR